MRTAPRAADLFPGCFPRRTAPRHSRLTAPGVVGPLWAVLVVVLVAATAVAQPPDPEHARIDRAYRSWLQKQSLDVKRAPDVLERYGAQLATEGHAAEEVARRLEIIKAMQRRTVEVWNGAFTDPNPTFNTGPNAFLVEMTKGVPPGRALDVGMGGGRNAIYLAQAGWDVTGFDPADKAVAAAEAAAKKHGVTLKTVVSTAEQFDFGREQWDLIVFAYVSLRDQVPAAIEALRPGGLVVVEGFHRDIARGRPRVGEDAFATNELLDLFRTLRIRHYEDKEGTTDYGPRRNKNFVVRLCAQKP